MPSESAGWMSRVGITLDPSSLLLLRRVPPSSNPVAANDQRIGIGAQMQCFDGGWSDWRETDKGILRRGATVQPRDGISSRATAT